MKKMAIVSLMKIVAERHIFSGLISSPLDQQYLNACRYMDFTRGAQMIFTRDSGHHSGGWWKNPDYERCYHLSISFFDPKTGERAPFRRREAEKWVKLFFGFDSRWVWCEPPYSDKGKQAQVYHFRLFTDLSWKPIKPRGEVYSRELTEAGWKSFSDLCGNRPVDPVFAVGRVR